MRESIPLLSIHLISIVKNRGSESEIVHGEPVQPGGRVRKDTFLRDCSIPKEVSKGPKLQRIKTYHELLDRLHDVDEVTRFSSIDPIKRVTEALQRKAGRVEGQEDLVEDLATPEGRQTEDDVESHSGAVPNTSKDESKEVTSQPTTIARYQAK
jgi:hypothetical protein